jgi:hypothetical protein
MKAIWGIFLGEGIDTIKIYSMGIKLYISLMYQSIDALHREFPGFLLELL